LKHAKKSQYQTAAQDLKMAHIKKQNMSGLMAIADKYKISYAPNMKKAGLVECIQTYIQNVCLDPIEQVNASKIDLVTIGRNIQVKFDALLGTVEGGIESIDKVIIENQISPIANRMKTIQGMIAQYFIMKHGSIQIDFVNASNKLKCIAKTGDEDSKGKTTTTYGERKKKSLEQTMDYLKKHGETEWLGFFMNNKKKDDLGDCFLQAYWYIFMK
jgi:hypothetical protein